MIALSAAKAELARSGWTVLRGLPFLAGGRPDPDRVLEVAAAFGTPSARDGNRPVWPVAAATDRPGATFSLRAGEARLHTDAQYHRRPEDLVCLFCVRPAAAGGHTRVLHAADAVAAVRRHPRARQVLLELARPQWSWVAPEVFQAESGHRSAILPGDGTIRWRGDNLRSGLSVDQVRAAAAFEACVEAASGVVEVRLGAGDLVVLDNRRTMHGRTAFWDRCRLLLRVRLWARQ
jgi:alpha-ketoglutarate-dependent taurine dioxygenase